MTNQQPQERRVVESEEVSGTPQSVGSTAAANYDRIWTTVYGDMQESGPVHRHLNRIVREIVSHLEYRSVLDVGCGPGHNLSWLGEGRALNRISGADVSPLAVEAARRDFAGDFHVLDIECDRLPSKWDLVHCSLVLEHVRDDGAALQNLAAMTDKYLLVSTIGGDFERYRKWDERVGHVRNYRVGELEEKLRGAGLRLCRIMYWGFPFYSPIARVMQNASTAGTGKFGWAARIAAAVLYHLYFLNSYKRGDIIIALATPA